MSLVARMGWGAVIVVAFLGCAEAEPPAAATLRVEVDTLPGGIVHVANHLDRPEAEGPRWGAVEELRISPPVLGRPMHLAVDHEARKVFHLDVGHQELRVFGWDGELVDRVSLRDPESGVGRQVWGIQQGLHGGMLIRDSEGFSRLDDTGAWVDRHPTAFVPARLPYQSRWLEEHLVEWEHDWFYGPGEGEMTRRWIPVRYSPDFLAADSLAPIEHTSSLVPGTLIPAPQSDRVVQLLDDRGDVWVALSRDYRVVRRSLAGDTTLVFTRSHVPVTIAEADKPRVAEAWSDVDEIPVEAVPDTEEVLLRIVEGDRGRILVFPNVRGYAPGSVADVFSEGVYEGRIELPVALNVNHHAPVVRGGYIHGVIGEGPGTTEFHVVRLRIEGDW